MKRGGLWGHLVCTPTHTELCHTPTAGSPTQFSLFSPVTCQRGDAPQITVKEHSLGVLTRTRKKLRYLMHTVSTPRSFHISNKQPNLKKISGWGSSSESQTSAPPPTRHERSGQISDFRTLHLLRFLLCRAPRSGASVPMILILFPQPSVWWKTQPPWSPGCSSPNWRANEKRSFYYYLFHYFLILCRKR